MATKSFFKTVDIRDKHSADVFSSSLQKAENISPTNVEYKSTPKELKGSGIKDFIDDYKKQHDKK